MSRGYYSDGGTLRVEGKDHSGREMNFMEQRAACTRNFDPPSSPLRFSPVGISGVGVTDVSDVPDGMECATDSESELGSLMTTQLSVEDSPQNNGGGQKSQEDNRSQLIKRKAGNDSDSEYDADNSGDDSDTASDEELSISRRVNNTANPFKYCYDTKRQKVDPGNNKNHDNMVQSF